MIEVRHGVEEPVCFGIVPKIRLRTTGEIVVNMERLLQAVLTTNPELSKEAKSLLQCFNVTSEYEYSQEPAHALPKTIIGVFTRLKQLRRVIAVLETHAKFHDTYKSLKKFSLQGYQVLHVRAVELCIHDVLDPIGVNLLDMSQIQMISELIDHLQSELRKCMQDEPCAFGFLVSPEFARDWSEQLRVTQARMVSCLESRVSREEFSEILFQPE